jgi:hypothetical protein
MGRLEQRAGLAQILSGPAELSDSIPGTRRVRMRTRDKGVPRLLFWTAIPALSFLGACRPIVSGCTYADTPGTATVTLIDVPPANLYNCPSDPVQVVFDFTPTDTTLAKAYSKGRRVTVGSGANPNRAYILSKGFAVGKVLPCIRQDVRSGSCSPTVFTFPGIDLGDYAQSCFATNPANADAGAR